MKRERNEDGMLYRGACDLIHIADGQRAEFGDELAMHLAERMRREAYLSTARTHAQAYGNALHNAQALCPGCYMVALFNSAVALARANGQDLRELGASMALAFQSLADGGADRIESINVILDAAGDSPITAGFDGQRVRS